MKLNIFLVLLALLLFSCLGSNIQEGFGIAGDFRDLGDDVGNTIDDFGQGVGDVAGGVGNVIGGVGRGLGDVVGGFGRGVGDVVGGAARGVGDAVGGVGRGVGDVIGGVGRGIDDALGLGYAADDYYDRETGSYGDRYPYSRDRYPYSRDRYPYERDRYPYSRDRYPRSRYPIVEHEERPQHDPREDDDEWIKKSQIVPPVCPKCPDVRTCRQTPCPPCPPCGRCPDPAPAAKLVGLKPILEGCFRRQVFDRVGLAQNRVVCRNRRGLRIPREHALVVPRSGIGGDKQCPAASISRHVTVDLGGIGLAWDLDHQRAVRRDAEVVASLAAARREHRGDAGCEPWMAQTGIGGCPTRLTIRACVVSAICAAGCSSSRIRVRHALDTVVDR